jgi:hypothetical protein
VKRDDETTLLWVLAGFWVFSRYTFDVTPALKQAGVRAYEALHDDQGHKRDLPGHQMTRAALRELATRAGFPNVQLAVAIALAESGGVPQAVTRSSRENSIGLWQINLMAHPQYTEDDMKNPELNANAAFAISKGGNDWRPWSAYKNGAFQRYL